MRRIPRVFERGQIELDTRKERWEEVAGVYPQAGGRRDVGCVGLTAIRENQV